MTAASPAKMQNAESSLTDRAYRILEEMLVTLKLDPGSVLSETALAERLGIGRTPIREALQRLSREGLITILPRKGILVTEINPAKQLRLLEVRRALERLMAQSGARRSTAEEREAFLEIASGMEAAARENDDLLFMRHDDALNRLVSKAARNEYASRAMALLHSLSRRFWYMHYKESADLPLCARLHADLARKIASGDSEAAADASDRLIQYVETFTKATITERI